MFLHCTLKTTLNHACLIRNQHQLTGELTSSHCVCPVSTSTTTTTQLCTTPSFFSTSCAAPPPPSYCVLLRNAACSWLSRNKFRVHNVTCGAKLHSPNITTLIVFSSYYTRCAVHCQTIFGNSNKRTHTHTPDPAYQTFERNVVATLPRDGATSIYTHTPSNNLFTIYGAVSLSFSLYFIYRSQT